jgi:hypothetical protein
LVLAVVFDDATNRAGASIAVETIQRIIHLTEETWIAETDVIRYYRLLLRLKEDPFVR